MEALKELLSPKTVNRFSYMANVFWIGIGVVLSSIFLDMEINESRSDFRCAANSDKDLIHGKCFEQYEKQYNKLGIPVYGFVIFNFFVTTIVVGIYTQCIKSRIEELETRNMDVERPAQLGNPTRRKLFKAYCCQLATRFVLGILFIILQTEVLYVSNFPSSFNCNLKRDILNNTTASHASGNITEKQTYECHNQRANKKTFWTNAVIVVTGFFAFLVFIEVIWILSRVRKGNRFMEDSQFLAGHIKSNYNQIMPEQEHKLQESQQLKVLIQDMKDSVIKDTERLSDFASPFRCNPGEGDNQPKHLQLDQIYTNLIIHPGRAKYDFTGDREKQLKQYPMSNANLPPRQPKDIIGAQHKNILVVGRPGIGKTIFCTKFLRDWATDRVFNEAENSQLHFDAAFLVKFRKFNQSEADLNLRDLLADSEFLTHLNDEFWDYILENPTKVLLVFDGIDEFNAKEKIAKGDSDFRNNEEEKMPLRALYNKVATGKLLNGATVLTTTRPTAVSCVKHIDFNRTVEILGFTSQQVKEYVSKFTIGFTNDEQKAAGETIWLHISSNLNIFSLCYVPVNCFIICMCLLHILIKQKSNPPCSLESPLPTKLTDIYSIAIKIFLFRHNDKYRNSETDGHDIIYESFDELTEDVKGDFKRLGELAFRGIKEGRLIFASDEVKKLEDCGLLHRLPDLEAPLQRPFERPRAQFCFMHLTVQELFAARHVTDTMNDAELREFICDHINEGTWQVVMQFVAGLLSGQETSSTDIFTDLLPVSTAEIKEIELTTNSFDNIEDSESRRLTCWPAEEDKPLALTLCKCWHEIDVKNSTLQNKLSEISFNAVDFSKCTFGPVGLTAVLNLLQDHKVLSLNLESNSIGSLGCIVIQKLLASNDNDGICKLRSLNLSDNMLTDEAVRHLVKALKDSNCKLSSLNLSDNMLTDEAVRHLVKALKDSNCKLSSLNLSDNIISHEGVNLLVEALTHINCKLNSLILGDTWSLFKLGKPNQCMMTLKTVKHLVEALTHSNCLLTSLSLTGIFITDHENVNLLVKALTHSNCKLSSLNLSHNWMTHETVKHLVEALTHSNCKLSSLNLSFNRITHQTIKRLVEALTHSNCKLSNLYLSYNSLTHENVKLLFKALTHSNCKLSNLDLSNNSLTHEDVKLLFEALTHSNCKLTSLNLSHNEMTHETVKHLVEALTHSNCKLSSLDLSYNKLTYEDIQSLRVEARIQSNCTLKL